MTVHIVVDVESDGPVPGLYSMVAIGAVLYSAPLRDPRLDTLHEVSSFHRGPIVPISEQWDPEALEISGFSREDQLSGKSPEEVMKEFDEWIKTWAPKERRIFWSDNPAFDWQWVNYYFHSYLKSNPFGYSARRIGDVFAGLEGNLGYDWKQHRETVHDHNPLNDARGNGEALKLLSKSIKGWQ